MDFEYFDRAPDIFTDKMISDLNAQIVKIKHGGEAEYRHHFAELGAVCDKYIAIMDKARGIYFGDG